MSQSKSQLLSGLLATLKQYDAGNLELRGVDPERWRRNIEDRIRELEDRGVKPVRDASWRQNETETS